MQNMARGVGLSGLATLILACAMAAPAAAVQVPRTQVQLNVHIARPNPLPGGRIKTFKPNATPGINTVKGSLVHTQKGLQQNKKLQQKYIPNTPTGSGAASVGGIDVTKQVDPTNTSNPSGGTLEGSGGTLELGGGTTGGGGILKEGDLTSPNAVKGTGTTNINQGDPDRPVNIGSEYNGGGIFNSNQATGGTGEGGGIFNSNQATGGTGEGGGIFNSNQATGGSGGLNSGVPLSVGGGGTNPGGGMFETNLRDERFLPFEDAGAIGTWTLTLPSKHSAFDYSTISDVILHIHSTERSSTSSLPGQGIGSGGNGGQGGSLFPTAGNAITRYRNGAQYPMPR